MDFKHVSGLNLNSQVHLPIVFGPLCVMQYKKHQGQVEARLPLGPCFFSYRVLMKSGGAKATWRSFVASLLVRRMRRSAELW